MQKVSQKNVSRKNMIAWYYEVNFKKRNFICILLEYTISSKSLNNIAY